MSLQHALSFITMVRQNDVLREELQALEPGGTGGTLNEYVAAGARQGMHFSVEELEAAFRHEWTMRSIGFGLQRRQ